VVNQERAFDGEIISEFRPILYALCALLALAMVFGSFVFYQTLKRTNFNFSCRYIHLSIGNAATVKKPEAKSETKKAPPAPAPAMVKTEPKTQKAGQQRRVEKKLSVMKKK
jgi:hypothetical protein